MRLTDHDLATIFKYGISVTQESHHNGDDPEDVIPLRGTVTPHDENADWFNVWVTEGMNSVFTRDVDPDGRGGYINNRLGVTFRFFPLPKSRKFVHHESYIDQMQEFFGPADTWPVFRAVSEDHDLDFNAIMFPEKDDDYGPFIGYMRPNAEKDFYMEISATEKHATEWIVTTTNGRWALRRLHPLHASRFIDQLREEGIDVG